MVIKNVSLDIVCGITSKLPDTGRPEIAFAGKSNVGKSSLINGLLNRKALARTSSQPGKTQTINFYNVNDFMYLVDLPGYGYAKVPETEKAKWGKMIERYLHTSQTLKAVFLLIDIRHDPSANDKLMYDWIVNTDTIRSLLQPSWYKAEKKSGTEADESAKRRAEIDSRDNDHSIFFSD